ncbi:MAG: pyridoxamine 5'-phosphate oxidase [Armatimonadetes bacterium Cent15-Ar3]|nr:MAG: pyridoxamine 5'-phosphate oxidase [Armatimonadetes bacterium Cent15-Ar3]
MQRSDYTKGELMEGDVLRDPFAMFREWLGTARDENVVEPEAFCLSTATVEGRPSARMLLLRGVDHGLLFYTNYLSRKGRELTENPFAAMTFWWGDLERQVRIEGEVHQVTAEESDAYFASRPASSRQASAASPQSQVVSGRDELEERVAAEGTDRPDHWGGYRLVPTAFEFWQGRPSRLHDRIRFSKVENGWLIERLAP